MADVQLSSLGTVLKATYEAEADTNAFTDAEKAKLASAYEPGGTDVAVADGGTGASTAAVARTNLGLEIGLDVAAASHNHDGVYAPVGHSHSAADLTSGTLADARVAQSNVTQHQAALAITQSQISDLDHDAVKLRGTSLDPTVGSPADGDILVYRSAGADWVLEAKPAGGSNPALAEVTDVSITSVGDNEVLAFDSGSGEWINQTAQEAGLASASHTHTLSEVTDNGALAALDTVGSSEIADEAVTLAKLAPIATASFLGRTTAATGDVEVLSAAAARAVLNVEDGATADQTAGEIEAIVNHDNLVGFVADEHVAHGSVTLTAGEGLTGGGTIAASRTIDLDVNGLTPEAALDGAADYVVVYDASAGGHKKVLLNDLPAASGGDAAPTQLTSNATPFALADASRAHLNVEVLSHTAGVDFEVPAAAAAGSKWYLRPKHDGCTVSVASDVGTVNASAAGSARLINGQVHVVEVDGNAGSAPDVLVRAVPTAPGQVNSTKTYVTDDHAHDFEMISGAGTQTFSAAANYAAGFFVNIFNTSGASITIAGADASHTLSSPGVATVQKLNTGLYATGTDGITELDAA